jgi:hypothetical protein
VHIRYISPVFRKKLFSAFINKYVACNLKALMFHGLSRTITCLFIVSIMGIPRPLLSRSRLNLFPKLLLAKVVIPGAFIGLTLVKLERESRGLGIPIFDIVIFNFRVRNESFRDSFYQ